MSPTTFRRMAGLRYDAMWLTKVFGLGGCYGDYIATG